MTRKCGSSIKCLEAARITARAGYRHALEMQIGRLCIVALGQRDGALGCGGACRPQHLRIFRCLRLLAQAPRFLCRSQLRLCRLAQQLTRLREVTIVDLGLGLSNQSLSDRIVMRQRRRR